MIIETSQSLSDDKQIGARILAARYQSPNNGTLYINGKETPLFSQTIGKVDAACLHNGICSHGDSHGDQVSRNALTLAANLTDFPYTDAEIYFLGKIHDIGYASKKTTWKDFYGTNHEQQSARIFNWLRKKRLGKLKQIFPETAETIDKHGDVYEFTIGSNEAKAQDYLSHPDFGMLPMVMWTADLLAYFDRNRVKHLPAPRSYEQNPYYFLAAAVENYHIQNNESKLVYGIMLQDDFNVQTTDGNIHMNFEFWHAQTSHHFPVVWDVATRFAKATGKNFTIVPETGKTTPQHATL